MTATARRKINPISCGSRIGGVCLLVETGSAGGRDAPLVAGGRALARVAGLRPHQVEVGSDRHHRQEQEEDRVPGHSSASCAAENGGSMRLLVSPPVWHSRVMR